MSQQQQIQLSSPPQQQQTVTINLAGGKSFQVEDANEAIILETNAELASLNRDLEATAEAMRDLQALAVQQGIQLETTQQGVDTASRQVEEGVTVLDDIPCCACCSCCKCFWRACCPSFGRPATKKSSSSHSNLSSPS